MSLKTLAKAEKALRKAAAAVAWKQWSAVSTIAPGSERAARALVDPEALVLVSMALSTEEPRLWRVCKLWARSGVRLLSVQRTKNLVNIFGNMAEAHVAEFATIAVVHGNDRRWHSLAGSGFPGGSSRKEPTATPLLVSPAALMLRVRLGLGVGIKADVLAYLVGCAGGNATIQQIAAATRYHGRAVRRSVEELASAGFIETRLNAPVSYRVNLTDWQGVLDFDPDNPPAWRRWADLYSFVVAVSAWFDEASQHAETVVASQARDMWDEHREALQEAGVRQTRPGEHPGAAFLVRFERALVKVAEYMEAVV